MKRILALSLLLVLVLSMGAMAQGLVYDIGSLENGDLEIDVEFSVTIDKYARVWLTENKLFKNALLGRPGLYTSDEDQVIDLAEEYFATKLATTYWPQANEDWMGKLEPDEANVGYDRKGGALFRVESNCDTNVNVELAWNNGMESELVLWVFRHQDVTPYSDYPPVNSTTQASLISTKNPTPINFEHVYGNQRDKMAGSAIEYKYSEYKIGGAVFIDYIGQQAAATYSGTITITVSAPVQ